MQRELAVSIGQYSDKGRKDENQDFHGALIPDPPTLGLKGISIALADGISTSSVARVAAEMAIKSFLTDYYCTSESWSVKTSAQRVIAATNAWLHSQSKRGPNAQDQDRGYVCTLSVLVLKATTAHIFHIGDARIYRLSGQSLEQLTDDHRVSVSTQTSYLGRALGVNSQVEIDYRAFPLEVGDVYLLATDGVYEHVRPSFISKIIAEHAGDLDLAAKSIVSEAYARGSADNLTVQIVRIDTLPQVAAIDAAGVAGDLPLPPLLEPRMVFDGYRIERQLHASSRSHIYLAMDIETGSKVALKIPSIDLRDDPNYLKRFLMEEWVARRIDNAHVLKPCDLARKRGFLYVTMEYVEGQTLRQWIIDNPRPQLEAVREMLEQVARGLRAFHRKEMLHQDLRPDNIMIDTVGTVKIIDFGSTRVAGVTEVIAPDSGEEILGTAQYTAPEYFVGERATSQADIYSLGVIAYQMLTGQLPYGAGVSRARTRSALKKLVYTPAREHNADVPAWVDGALQRAVQLDPTQRYEALSEFLLDLRHPNPRFLRQKPLIERNPLRFWQACTVLLVLSNLITLYLMKS